MKVKRVFDVIITFISLLACLPLITVIAVIVCCYIGTPIIFQQARRGLRGQSFVIYKFRTMLDQYNAQGTLLPDDERVTALGAWLRSSSLDELPQLWNVLKGDMSLVGPRPLLVEEPKAEQPAGQLSCYAEAYSIRHAVPPGITGWAQINGRNALSLEEKLALDLWYVEHHNLWLDFKILLLTIKPVLLRRNI